MCSTLPSVPPSPAPDPTVAVLQVHLILRHKSPKTNKWEEKHLASPPSAEGDSKTHVYTAILRASNNSCVRCGVHACVRPALPCHCAPALHCPSPCPDTHARAHLSLCTPPCPAPCSYAVLIDGVEKKAGSIFEDFEPAFNPPEMIDDPTDSKPSDWVDDEKHPDPTAVKPDDWDEDAPM